ncbi:MAG: FAD-dependent oxidoreductase [Clostridia bacterium]|nr:FAD-dependent oxidoreductase [Clostridia bacterium]MBO4883735.1 FAD-dependent oxidoreductase [Clostridia bacterium]MBR4443787.1 FAD-dependent oxidoreductase [Clostridia bacterium]
MSRQYDVAIVGAGVVGCAIARQLSRYDLRIALIDAAEDVAMGASRANSAIVHAGYDCPPGSIEARMNVIGNALYRQWADELEVPFKRCGSFVIGFGPEDEKVLSDLYDRGVKNGVPGMTLMPGCEARAMEPALSKDVTMALFAATAGITCPYQMTIACAENARENGAEWLMNHPVTAMRREGDTIVITAGGEEIEARYVVNAAGVFSDEVSRMLGDDSFTVRPRKGEYMLLDRKSTCVETVIFQTPSKLGKGILVSPTVDGNMFAGPTAVDMTDKRDTSVTPEGIAQLTAMSKKSVPGIDLRSVITSFAGVRAQPSTGDFIIGASKVEPRLIQAAGICSPGLTSAPAIAGEIARILRVSGLSMVEKAGFNPHRSAIPEFRNLNGEQRAALIEKDARYGRVICRCETITEGEIVEAIRRGARSLDGVKRRTRAGMGRCQGGFCSPRVMEILSRELNVPMTELTKFGGESKLLVGKLKEV